MSSWSCPHDLNGVCQKVAGAVCVPGMRGCVLHGKVRLAGAEGKPPPRPVKATTPTPPRRPSKRRLPF